MNLRPFDVAVRRHYPRNGEPLVHLLGVYAVDYLHALEVARHALGIRGPMVYVHDVQANKVHHIDGQE